MATHGYEFGGPLGALAVTLGTPFLTYALYFTCNEAGCPSPEFLADPVGTFQTSLWPGWSGIFSAKATGYYLAYWFALVAMQYVLPGKTAEGVVLTNGTRLKYKVNAFESFMLVITYCGAMTYKEGFDWWVWAFVCDNVLQLITGTLLVSITIAFYCYISSFFTGEILAGNSGNYLYDWFIGRPLNPRIHSFDLKSFCELRPGMIMWPLLNFAFLTQQYRTYGRITDSMFLVNAFQFWYVFDALWNESAMLTTMDITTDGFGFMLSFGDLVWVPFVYSLQSRFLASHPVDLGIWGLAGVLAVQAMGYYTFRGANGTKNTFRTNPNDPSVKDIKYIETKSGSKLMISGWWGISRHVNYLGDWIMAWAWCLPTGFTTPIPYFYVVYFAVLLLHRERRDEAKCKIKYGKDWERYTSVVRYRIIPGVY
ncbi:erg24, C-14 sterol reductase [Maublancomyces gigas]|uniref:Delta(14)-sterol reductase n=1 Tax=Discina gigas TaxID=1032678 RepID=A0ABR3GP45_9PEZI